MPDLKPNLLIEFEPMNKADRTIYVINGAASDGTNLSGGTGWLQSRTISSVGTITPPTGMTLNSQSATTLAITIDVTSSTVGDFEFDIAATLSTGEIKNLTVAIPVRDPGSN